VKKSTQVIFFGPHTMGRPQVRKFFLLRYYFWPIDPSLPRVLRLGGRADPLVPFAMKVLLDFVLHFLYGAGAT